VANKISKNRAIFFQAETEELKAEAIRKLPAGVTLSYALNRFLKAIASGKYTVKPPPKSQDEKPAI
jgi:hypothetical protein